MRIYTERYGIPRGEVYAYMIYHDVAEVITGDIPFQIKRNMPQMKDASVAAEEYANYKLGLDTFKLTQEEAHQVKVCDLLEMREYAEIELAYGNSLAWDIVQNIDAALNSMNEVA